MDSLPDLVHIEHRRIITLLHQLIYLVKLKKGIIIHSRYQHTLTFRYVVIRIDGHDGLQLFVKVILISADRLALDALGSYYDIRMILVPHYLPWEIVVEPSVKKQQRVQLHRLEIRRKCHRGPYRGPQIPAVRHIWLLFHHISRHTKERNHQIIEIIASRRRGIGEYLDKGYVHRERGDQRSRQRYLYLAYAFLKRLLIPLHIDCNHRGSRIARIKMGKELPLPLSRIPCPELLGLHKGYDVIRRQSHGIKATHYGAYGSP